MLHQWNQRKQCFSLLKRIVVNYSSITHVSIPKVLKYVVVYLTSSWVFLALVGLQNARFTRVLNWPTRAKKPQFTHERVKYNVFLFDEPLKGSKSLKIFKISLTFRFDKWWHLSKSVHIGENSQILTVSNKKLFFFSFFVDKCGHFSVIYALKIKFVNQIYGF
jgi:hypothetical protein